MKHAAYCGTREIYDDMEMSAKSLVANSDVDLVHFIIEDSAFSGSGLTQCHIPSSVESIGEKAFYNCAALSDLSLPMGSENLESIGSQAFSQCTRVESVDVPKSATKIGSLAFEGIDTVAFPQGSSVLEVKAGMFSGCKNVSLGVGTTTIGSNGFSSALESVTLPDTVNLIGNSAFSSCSKLATIHIPRDVTSIGANAFSNCSALASIDLTDATLIITELSHSRNSEQKTEE